MVATFEQKFAQQYLMTSMKSPTLLGDVEGKPVRASDGGSVGVSTSIALSNMFNTITDDDDNDDDDLKLRERNLA